MGCLSPGLPPQGGIGSPKRKMPRGTAYNIFDDNAFPTMKTIQASTAEMFLHIKSEVEGKKMINLNRFKLEFHLSKIKAVTDYRS